MAYILLNLNPKLKFSFGFMMDTFPGADPQAEKVPV